MKIYYVNFILHYLLLFPLRAKEEIEYPDFMFLLTGGVGLQNTIANPNPSWLQDKSWDEICRASELPGLQGIKYKASLTQPKMLFYYFLFTVLFFIMNSF